MSYVDGFVLVVPTKKLTAYKALAKKAAKVWKEHGALEYFECAGDDMKTHCGVDFPKLAKAGRSDTVIFSFIVYASKAHRNAVNRKVMNDKRITSLTPEDMPFDVQKMSYGGFKTLVKA